MEKVRVHTLNLRDWFGFPHKALEMRGYVYEVSKLRGNYTVTKTWSENWHLDNGRDITNSTERNAKDGCYRRAEEQVNKPWNYGPTNHCITFVEWCITGKNVSSYVWGAGVLIAGYALAPQCSIM